MARRAGRKNRTRPPKLNGRRAGSVTSRCSRREHVGGNTGISTVARRIHRTRSGGSKQRSPESIVHYLDLFASKSPWPVGAGRTGSATRLYRHTNLTGLSPQLNHRTLGRGDSRRGPPGIMGASPRGGPRISRFSSRKILHVHGFFDRAGPDHRLAKTSLPVLPSASANGVGTLNCVISRLNSQPVHAPVNASPASSRVSTHDSGSQRFAIPSM